MTQPDASPTTPSAPRRRLSLFDILCIGVNATVGSGVFALPDDIHREMGGWSPLAFLICSVLLLPISLCFAELGSRHEETGGTYLYARNAFGPNAGFIVGWYCWMSTVVGWAAVTTLFVELLGFRGGASKIISVAAIVILGAVNYFGVKLGAWVVNLVVIGKLTAILCFVGVAILAFEPSRLGGALPLGLAGLGNGVYLALFPLQGFEVAPITAGETKNPRRNVPLGTMGSLLFSALLFVVVQAVMVSSYPLIGDESTTPLVDAARFLGPVIGLIVLVGGLISTGGFTAGSALGSPRYAQAIAEHGLLPSALARIHPRWQTPYFAIVLTTGLSAGLALFFDYRQLVGMSNITVLVQYLATCLAVPILRKKMIDQESSFNSSSGWSYRGKATARGQQAWMIPWGSTIPYLGAVSSLVLLLGLSFAEVVFAAVTLVIGVVVGILSAKKR